MKLVSVFWKIIVFYLWYSSLTYPLQILNIMLQQQYKNKIYDAYSKDIYKLQTNIQ